MNYSKSKSFQNALRKAAEIASDPKKISDLISSVSGKLSDMDENKKKVSGFFEKTKTLLRMLRAYINGEYRCIPWRSLLMIIGSLIYFLMPLDLIPDFIPVSGLADDISIIFLVFNSINEDIEAFLEFEQTQKPGSINNPSEI
ncbi:MAG: DUF1232 domain-containing protein [Cytophagales bacterium]|nr:DUF1232 domain-containing protein [Cytophagales bacterium]